MFPYVFICAYEISRPKLLWSQDFTCGNTWTFSVQPLHFRNLCLQRSNFFFCLSHLNGVLCVKKCDREGKSLTTANITWKMLIGVTHIHTCMPSKHSSSNLELFLLLSMGKQLAGCFPQPLSQPSVRGAVSPASDFFFPVVCRNNGARRLPLLSDSRSVSTTQFGSRASFEFSYSLENKLG